MDKQSASHALQAAEAGRSQLNRIFALLDRLNGKASPAEVLEESVFRVREGFQDFRLEPVESDFPKVDLRKAERPAAEMIYFGRAMQRTQLIGHFRSKGIEVPVHYALTGVIFLERRERKFHVWEKPRLRANVFVPFEFVEDKSILDEFSSDKQVHLVDTGGDRPEYTQLRIAAVRKARESTLDIRARLFYRLNKAVGNKENESIVGDGLVMDVPNRFLPRNFLATSRQAYVPWQNSELLEPQLLIPPYHRGQVMRIVNTVGDDPMPKYSWFIRMRHSSQAGPEFGLLRCTIVADDDNDAIERANAFSARLIDERLPVTYPAEDWDRLIFPLKVCLNYLESLVPTRETVKNYFARE